MAASSWRRNPWVWLVIAIPAATVIGCLITIYLAINNPHTIVSDAVSNHPAPRGSIASRPV
jgi:hypothetical protein